MKTMQVNLKKSAALQVAIREAVKELDLSTSTSVSIFSGDFNADIDAAAEKLKQAFALRGELQNALFEIRALTGAANAEHGVDALLAKTARVKVDIEALALVASASERETDAVIKGKIERLNRDAPVQPRGYTQIQTDEIRVGLLSVNEIDAIKEQLRIARRAATVLKDALLEKNIETKITLPEGVVKVLETARLI